MKTREVEFMNALRLETRPRHEALERTPLSMALMDGTLDPEGYRRLLASFYGIVRPLEEDLARYGVWERLGLEAAPRRKARLLEQDLLDGGVDPASVALRPSWLRPEDVPGQLGCAYVLEGSTLGGQVVARRIACLFDRPLGEGARFFVAYGPRTGTMWQEFRGALSRYATEHGIEAEVMAAAARTFAEFELWMTEGAS